VQARIGPLALVLLALSGASAQEIVLTNGSRLEGTVERYENGFAYIRLVKEGGKTVLTTMPESAVDKAATEQAQATSPSTVETPQAQTGPFKLPHNDSSLRGPAIADVAAEEKERRAEAMDSGAATGRLFRNGQGTTSIPTARQIAEVADLTQQPKAQPDVDVTTRVAGLRFYETRLETLSSAFVRLGDEWEEMWRHCTPVNYVGGGGAASPSDSSRPKMSFHEAVMSTFRRTSPTRVDGNWNIACVRKDSDFVARGRQVVEAYELVFTAYADFAEDSGQSAQAVARALPTKP
jgi:hypothetical protein